MNEKLRDLEGIGLVCQIQRGIERECLRVTPDGRISQKPHPKALGSALTHPNITTDYSEALLEFVTPIFNCPKSLLEFLKDIHIFTVKNMENEILWNNSMPCLLDKQNLIPIALYGNSNVGQMKSIYREGLRHRYGSAMQVISGIHFNFSLTDKFLKKYQELKNNTDNFVSFKSQLYMGTARNIHRYSWLIPYLLGSSPAICKSFLNKAPQEYELLEVDEKGTLSYDGATSLRLSNLGYTNSDQNVIDVSYNDVNSYVKGLRQAILTPSEKFKKIGIKTDGRYNQLSHNILQIENEYYAEVRPKQPINSGESPTSALLDRGIEYIELRSVDINAYSPIGIDLDQILFLDVFLLYCLFEDSEFLCPEKTNRFRLNQENMAKHGRQIDFTLFNGSKDVNALDWAKELFENFSAIAEFLDSETGKKEYTNAINKFAYKLIIPTELNSARIMRELEENKETFFHNTLNRSLKFTKELQDKKVLESKNNDMIQVAKNSHTKQKEIEDSDKLSFEDYLQQYFAQNQ